MHPPRRKLWETTENGEFAAAQPDDRKPAFLGVRGCDLAALGVLGRVLGNRIRPFIVAVDCTEPGGLCFCASMGTGPGVRGGYDVALTERIDDSGHWFLATAGSEAGERILATVARREASSDEVAAALRDVTAAGGRMGRAMPELDLRELLRDSRTAQRWNDVADRCLTCGNCTMVCPTCFCTTTEDVTDLTGDHAERWEHWASCFEVDFSYLHGGSVRTSAASRYRQWLTHKLGAWHDQFGESGCVGCGRCIAWCPVGIDITTEMAALAAERSADDVDV
ncbi:4Fe-4S dicluster domain-containing protein [Kutzneria sp. 744]|uniref:4Fe-4S dicluster domain-containing protein n=1 Tax=Kutzneria sp. (strain 744) TaxID=345341 RepID=UPI0003EEA711|nr:4Fe-4S dicluster domain-containing protein [Kutzneria sp. 744]EWM10206.1 ABC transporter permease component [Kutzneria sp. 744]